MKILVVSDTHGHTDRLKKAIDACLPFDMLLHCGDGIKDIGSVDIPEGITVAAVRGNTDMFSYCDSGELIIENILDRRVAITHGHRFNVKAGTSYLVAGTAGSGVYAVIFGHTHVKQFVPGAPVLFNPGALSENSYGLITASEGAEWLFEHRVLA